MSTYQIEQNSIYPRCVDGRAAEVFLEQQDGQWAVAKRGDDARLDNGPQFLGASLLFVRALEVVAGRGRLRAFEFVEQASQAAGFGLQIHLDDHHGEYELAGLSDAELVALVNHHHTGCGFAAYSWGDGADRVIEEAKRRGWRIQMLVGEHAETGAAINFRAGETFDTAVGVEAGASVFNTDVLAARAVFEKLGELIHMPDFAQKAETWMLETYQDVVIALKGVKTADEIVERR